MERVDALYRAPLENQLGYSFDRTLRHYFVHRAGIASDPESRAYADLITPGAQAVLMNADEALKAGMISMRTRDLLSILSRFRCDHAQLVSGGEWERMSGFLALAAECSKLDGGSCEAGTLIELALRQGIVEQERPGRNRRNPSLRDRRARSPVEEVQTSRAGTARACSSAPTARRSTPPACWTILSRHSPSTSASSTLPISTRRWSGKSRPSPRPHPPKDGASPRETAPDPLGKKLRSYEVRKLGESVSMRIAGGSSKRLNFSASNILGFLASNFPNFSTSLEKHPSRIDTVSDSH